MSRPSRDSTFEHFRLEATTSGSKDLREAFHALDVIDRSGRVVFENLPFSRNDTTVGTETELQVAVCGSRSDVDLLRTVESSNYFANAIRRAATGDLHRKLVTDIERFMSATADNVWENSWVRFGRAVLYGLPKPTLAMNFSLEVPAHSVRSETPSPSEPHKSSSYP